ncbi:MAG: hypothetical protein ABR582_03865 [Gemmatimonadaceae bacterium]
MVDALISGSGSITEALSRRARTRSEPRLSADLVGGALIATTALVWRPAGWFVITTAALCLAAFGAWGFADRLLGDRRQGYGRAVLSFLLVFRTIAVAVGVVASALLVFGFADLVMGTWIS